MQLTDFRTLGRSGLVIRPLTLGTMTFGTARWGADQYVLQKIFSAYVDAGGKFIDTADICSGGKSQETVGQYTAERNLRDNLALATKFSFNVRKGNPNAGGNGRKNLHCALAQVALAWTLARPAITSTVIGASKLDQVEDNLVSLEIRFSAAQMDALNAGSVLDPSCPDGFFSSGLKQMIFGGNSVQGWG